MSSGRLLRCCPAVTLWITVEWALPSIGHMIRWPTRKELLAGVCRAPIYQEGVREFPSDTELFFSILQNNETKFGICF